jgi:threonine/homoserine/homoserine lactone efflux protein
MSRSSPLPIVSEAACATSMNWNLLGALVLFVTAMTFTPGPNNLIALTSGANFGIARTLPFIAGAVFGFLLIVGILFAGAGAAIAALPGAMPFLKVAGSLYLLWLAWRIAAAEPGEADPARAARPLGFGAAALIQWLNPKGWTMALVAIGSYAGITRSAWSFALLGVLVFGLLMFPAMLTWTAVGAGVARLAPRHLRLINRIMAVLLVASVALVWID